MVNGVGVLLGTVYDFLQFLFVYEICLNEVLFITRSFNIFIFMLSYDNVNTINILKKGLVCFLQKIIDFCIYDLYVL